MDIQEALIYLNDKDKIPVGFNRLYKKWKDVYYTLSLHTLGARPKFKSLDGRGGTIIPPNYLGEEYQKIFNEVLFSRHPRENEHTRQWRFSQYKPITRTPFLQIIDLIQGAIFQDSNYTFTLPDEEDTKYLIDDNNFNGYDLMGWFANVAIPSIMDDPNGIIVTIPSKPFYEIKEDKVPIALWYINSKNIVYADYESIIFKKDNYAYFINLNVIYRYEINKDGKYYISGNDSRGYYATLLDRLPLEKGGGIWNADGLYDSYLIKAQAVADDFVSSYSAEQMVDKEASHPFIIMAEEQCPSCSGIGSIQFTCEECPGGVELRPCNQCSGRGTISVNPGDRLTAPAEMMDKDLIKIVNPNISINEYHHKKTNDIYNRLLDALNLLKVDEAQSGIAKTIDEGRLHQFISKIANDLFDRVINNTVKAIIAYRNVKSSNGNILPGLYSFTLIKPTQYQIKTASDLLNEYSEGTKANIPTFIRQKMALDYIDKQYSGDLILRKTGDLILKIDALAVLSEQEKMTKLINGEIDKEDLVLSLRLPQIIRNIVYKNGDDWFIEARDNIITDVILQYFDKEYKPDKFTEYEDESILPNNAD